MTVLTIISIFLIKPVVPQIEIVAGQLFFVIGSILLFIPLIIHSRGIEVNCDFQPEKVNPLWVQVGQIFAIAAAVIVWLLQGLIGIIDLMPLWSSIFAVSLVYLIVTLFDKSRPNVRSS